VRAERSESAREFVEAQRMTVISAHLATIRRGEEWALPAHTHHGRPVLWSLRRIFPCGSWLGDVVRRSARHGRALDLKGDDHCVGDRLAILEIDRDRALPGAFALSRAAALLRGSITGNTRSGSSCCRSFASRGIIASRPAGQATRHSRLEPQPKSGAGDGRIA